MQLLGQFLLQKMCLEAASVPLFLEIRSPKMLQPLRLMHFERVNLHFVHMKPPPPRSLHAAFAKLLYAFFSNKWFNLHSLLPCSLLGASLEPPCSVLAASLQLFGEFFFSRNSSWSCVRSLCAIFVELLLQKLLNL